MPELPRLEAAEAERMLLKAGFVLLRTRGSHRVYGKGTARVVVPFHRGKTLHPKVTKQIIDAIGRAGEDKQ